jgi:hypothetical protein
VFRGESGRITALRFKKVQTEVHYYCLERGVYLKFSQKGDLKAFFSSLFAFPAPGSGFWRPLG